MEPPVTSNLISASAGTGKTYKLASRFISLLALGYPAERLIALTFTRYAAGEFKGRILRDLAQGAASDTAAEKLTARIRDTLSGGARHEVALCPRGGEALPLGRAQYLALLRQLIRKLPQLNLATLDSFFSKLVSAYCLELGYPSVVQLDEAEQAKARREAICALLDYRAEDEDGLLELCQEVSAGSRQNILDVLEESIVRYHTLYQDTKDAGVWGVPESFGVVDERVLATLHEHLEESSAEAEAFLLRFVEEQEVKLLAEAQRLKEEGRIYGHAVTDCRGLFSRLRKYLGYAKCSSRDDLSVSKRLAPYLYGAQADADVAELMRELRYTRDVVTWLPPVRKTRGIYRLLQRYDARYCEEVRATGRLVFDDMPRLVADKLLNEDFGSSSNIAYRLDGRLDHWMLDEFQDTSPEQWAALKVLLCEVRDEAGADALYRSAGRSLFVVGDEKQSIYGFRGATPRLFSYLKADPEWSSVLQLTRQNESYRSAPAIMGRDEAAGGGFVNALFRGLLRVTGRAELEEFTHHGVAAALRNMAGYVRVETCTDQEPDALPAKEAMCCRMAEILEREVQFAKGGLTVAILVRSNSEVSFICNWFRKNHKELPVESLADEKVGSASLLGEFFLHFFKWMQHPGDAFSRGMLRACLSLPGEGALPGVLRAGESAEEAWNRWRRLLEAEGYAAVLRKLTAAPGGGVPVARRDRAYREWLNEARAFDAEGGTLEEWLLYISHLKVKANPPKSCVHVMTYHKSKGAEYDVVLLPFSSPKAAYKEMPFLKKVVSCGDRDEVVGVMLNPRIPDKEAADSPYFRLAEQHRAALVSEAFHVLYVAVTRAKYANYILLNGYTGTGRKPQADSYAALLKEAVGEAQEWGDPQWRAAVPRREPPATDLSCGELAAPHPRRRLVSPSKAGGSHGGRGSAAEEALPAEDGAADAAAFGTAVHALFEQVEWLGAGAPPWLQAPLSAEEQLVAAALQVPELQKLYVQQPGQAAYNEQAVDALLPRGGVEVWVSGTLDRLVLSHEEGRVVAADIVDIKTDLRRGDSAAEQDARLRATHLEQMRLYHTLIMRALDLPPEAVRLTLISCPRDGAPARPVPYSAAELQPGE